MIKNYIFDFGNVLAEFYPDKLTAPFVPDTEKRKAVSEIAYDRLYWNRIDKGSVTDDEVKAEMRERAQGELGELACTVYENWVNTLTPVPGMIRLISDIRAKTDKKLYLLSNISIGFANTYKNVPWIAKLLSDFDGLVFSGPIGMVKPDREIFEHLLGKFGLSAEECLFIDDSRKNITGAEGMGIQGYLFDGDSEKLRDFLNL